MLCHSDFDILKLSRRLSRRAKRVSIIYQNLGHERLVELEMIIIGTTTAWAKLQTLEVLLAGLCQGFPSPMAIALVLTWQVAVVSVAWMLPFSDPAFFLVNLFTPLWRREYAV